MSYLLNDRYFAPIKYQIKISNYTSQRINKIKIINEKITHNYNCVILFSGGFDSSSALLYSLDQGWNPLLLWVGFGQKNEASEKRTVKRLAKLFNRKLVTINLKLHDEVKRGWKDWSYIVPGRNFMFATLGAAILARSISQITYILMGVTNEEYYHSDPCVDKSPRFFRDSSKLFSDYYHKKIQVTTPLKSVSKAELAAHWKNYWTKKYGIDPHETVSCYFGKNCGVCNSCFKRSISFLAAGIGLDENLMKNPFKENETFVKTYIERVFGKVGHKTKLSEKRAVETLIAYKKMYEDLPSDVQKIVNNIPLNLNKKVIREEKRLNTFIWKQNTLSRRDKKQKQAGVIYVARHGETEKNRAGLLLGQKDVELNETGIEQAHELGKRMKKLNIDLIVSSPMIRAKQTAEIVNSYVHKTLKVEPRLKERNIGVYEGLTLSEVQERYQKGYTSEMAYNKKPPNGESSQEVQERVFAAIDELKKNNPNKNILIISHSFIIRMINKYFNPNITADDFFDFTLKNAEVREFKL